MQETWVRSLDWEDPLEKEKATHCSILAWTIPWGRKESDRTERLHSQNTNFCHTVTWFAAAFEVCILANPDDSFSICERGPVLKLEAVYKTDLRSCVRIS